MTRSRLVWCILLLGSMVYPQTEFGNFMDREDYEYCYQGLQTADVDSNHELTADEFVEFARYMASSGSLDDVTTFDELPTPLQQAFQGVACLCSDSTLGYSDNATCCEGSNAYIRIPNASSVDNLLPDDRLYLYAACSYTVTAADSIDDTTNPLGTPLWPTSPTEGPTASLDSPTDSPTESPTPESTEKPSRNPTRRPNRSPTDRPTESSQNDDAPTSSPSQAFSPTAVPTPSNATVPDEPTAQPTSSPAASTSPTRWPSSPPYDKAQRAHVAYYFQAPKSGNDSNSGDILVSYLSDLQVAMNRLAPQVATQEDGTTSTAQTTNPQSALRHRSLQSMSVVLPTSFAKLVTVDCPSTVTNTSSSSCYWVVAVIPLDITDSNATANETAAIIQNFETNLSQAIAEGRLQEELLKVNPDTPISVFVDEDNGSEAPSPSPSTSDRSADNVLSPGAISGIAVAAVVVVLISLILLSTRKRSNRDRRKPGSFYVGDPAELGPSFVPDVDEEQPSSPPGSPVYESRHVAPSEGEELVALNEADKEQDEKSNIVVPENAFEKEEPVMGSGSTGDDDEGSSGGWSSNDGLTSLNRTRDAEGLAAATTAGVTLAAVGAAATARDSSKSAPTKNEEESSLMNVSSEAESSALDSAASEDEEVSSNALSTPIVSVPQSELESQIDAGDWAAVGATAALLAAASDSQSGASTATNSRASRASRRSGGTNDGDEAKRAAELDRLVDKGDWDGLIVAAARFEEEKAAAAENYNISSTVSSPRTGSSVSSGSVASGSDTGTGTIGSPSYETTASDSQGRTQRRNELRSEVEALVRRVVPEEIDNVDEMMEQFKGREEELVETLRNMQERSVAQKARAAKQKAAKVQARQSVQRGVVPGAQDVLSKTGDSESEGAEEDVSADDAALAAGASAAAALLGPFPTLSSASEGSRPAQQQDDTDAMDDRRSALEAAIDAGDWQAVGDAAAMMSDVSFASGSTGDLIDRYADANLSGYSEGSGMRVRSLGSVDAVRAEELDALVEKRDWAAVMEATKRFSTEDETKDKHKGPSKEEEEALQQAELWRQIAEQNQPGATDAGASSAAEWAIQRSLSQLNEADKVNAPSGDSEEV